MRIWLELASLFVLYCLSLAYGPDLVDPYRYSIVGICVGLAATFVSAVWAVREHAPLLLVVPLCLMTGFLAGLGWPATLGATIYYLTVGGWDEKADEGQRG